MGVGGGGLITGCILLFTGRGGGLKVGEGLIINWKFMVHC